MLRIRMIKFIIIVVVGCMLWHRGEPKISQFENHKWPTCGAPLVERRQRSPRIIGGTRAIRGEWPWQAALIQIDPSTEEVLSHPCGGALISKNWVITAAHCLVDPYLKFVLPPAFWRIALDVVNLNESVAVKDLAVITRIILHHKFSRETWANDLALLKIEGRGSATDTKSSLCLPNGSEEIQFCTVTGWGMTKEFGSHSEYLQSVQMPIWSSMQCQNKYKNTNKLTQNMFCAGDLEGGYGPCVGDSGSPLQCRVTGDRWVLVGITSWGIGCAKSDYPAVFMSTSNYLDWIYDHID